MSHGEPPAPTWRTGQVRQAFTVLVRGVEDWYWEEDESGTAEPRFRVRRSHNSIGDGEPGPAAASPGPEADIRFVQELLGHKSVETTQGYTHVMTSRASGVESHLDARGGEQGGSAAIRDDRVALDPGLCRRSGDAGMTGEEKARRCRGLPAGRQAGDRALFQGGSEHEPSIGSAAPCAASATAWYAAGRFDITRRLP